MLTSCVVSHGREFGVASTLASWFVVLWLVVGCDAVDGPVAATSVALLATQVAAGEIEGPAPEALPSRAAEMVQPTASTEPQPFEEAGTSSVATAVAPAPAETPVGLGALDTPETVRRAVDEPEATPSEVESDSFVLSSPAFEHGGTIPTIYTCDGQDTSPALAWHGAPEGTESFALICDDPDAPGSPWVHWIIYNVPAGVSSLPEAVNSAPVLVDGSLQGMNSWSRSGYGGPCPPSGSHRYVFRLYAIDTTLGMSPNGTDKQALLDAIAGHILGEAVLVGEYQR